MLRSLILLLSFSSSQSFSISSVASTTRPNIRPTLYPKSSKTTATTTTAIHGVIEAEEVAEEDGNFDTLGAGVKLAQESAIILEGVVEIQPTKNRNEVSINPISQGLTNYQNIQSLSSDDVSSLNVICKGSGTEVYQNPGSSTKSVVILAPLDAVSVAVDDVSTPSASPKKVLITFSGGDDLMVHEVLEATQLLVSSLDFIMDKAGGKKSIPSIEFRSLCHPSFPKEKCGVLALAVADEEDVSSNENIFWNDGQWWTVSDKC